MPEASVRSSKKKRIIFGTTVGLSADALLRGQLAWFREQGWDVTLVTTPDIEAKRAAAREKVSFLGIPMKRNISLVHDLRAALDWVRIVRKVRPHVVNLGTPKASLLGTLAACVHKVPKRIYTVRGLRLEGSSGFMAKLLWLMERITIRMATDVIAVSPSLGDELVSRNLASSHDIWIIGSGSSNGVNTSEIQHRVRGVDKSRLKHQLRIKSGSHVVGYVGRVSSAKGVDTLISALQDKGLEHDVELLIIGSVEDPDLNECIDQLGDRVHMIPWTEDVWGYLPVMDILCLPTHREGFPNTVLEAAAIGIPSITTRVTGAIDAVIHGKTGFLIEAADSETLATFIRKLLDDDELLSRLGTNARQYAEKCFVPEQIWSGIQAVALGEPTVVQVKRLDQYRK